MLVSLLSSVSDSIGSNLVSMVLKVLEWDPEVAEEGKKSQRRNMKVTNVFVGVDCWLVRWLFVGMGVGSVGSGQVLVVFCCYGSMNGGNLVPQGVVFKLRFS